MLLKGSVNRIIIEGYTHVKHVQEGPEKVHFYSMEGIIISKHQMTIKFAPGKDIL